MFDFRRPLTNSDNFLLRSVTKSKKGAERNLSLPLFTPSFPSRFLKPLAITEIKESETETCHRPILWGTRFDTKDLETKSSPSLPPSLFSSSFFFFAEVRALKRRTSPPFWRVDEDLGKYLVSLWWASRKYKRRIPSSLLFRTAWPGTRHSCSGEGGGWKNVGEALGKVLGNVGHFYWFQLVPRNSATRSSSLMANESDRAVSSSIRVIQTKFSHHPITCHFETNGPII